MRRFRFGLTALSSLGFFMAAPAAFAGHCNPNAGQNCHPGVVYNGSGAPSFDALSVNIRQPLEDLRSVHVRTAPAVSITRIYGQNAYAGVQDAPRGFTGGCHPTTTQYCRQNVSAPRIAAPAPVISPVVTSNIRYGRGYNPSASLPRQYGENTFTPGIAHIPTSYVDRSPHTANRLLASGLTRSYNTVSYNTISPFAGASVEITQPLSVQSSHSQTLTNPSTPVAADGTYWEKVSGPTLFGNTLATQVVCKRQAPVQKIQIQRQIVRPVVPVPVPVPVAAPVYCENSVVNSRYGYAPQAPSFAAPHIQAPIYNQPHVNLPRVSVPQAQGRWTY